MTETSNIRIDLSRSKRSHLSRAANNGIAHENDRDIRDALKVYEVQNLTTIEQRN
jgi:hypothetical protein